MSTRLGISIASDACAAVLVRRGRIRWHRRAIREHSASLESTLRSLFERRQSRRRPTVVVALGASYSQVKRVSGIPHTLARDVATRLVRENAASFFLVPSRLVTAGVERSLDGSTWSSALDAGTIDEVRGALAAIGLVARSFVADVVALVSTLPAGEHRMRDGEVQMEFATANGVITRCRRSRQLVSSGFNEELGALPSSLRALGDDAREYVAAFAAASMPLRNQLAWRPPPDPRRTARRRRAETFAATIALATSLVSAAAAPGVRAANDATRWTRQAAFAAAVRRESAAVDAELRRVTTTLDRLDRFQATRAEVIRLLGDLALALPDSTALLSLHVDTTEIDFAVLTPHAAEVIPELSDVNELMSPRIVGSVVRDAAAHVTLERATIRARRRQEPKSRSHALHVSAAATSAP
jgi:hypothetical protein